MTDDDADSVLMDVMRRCATMLGEHADSVQIFCTRVRQDGDTTSVDGGCGNWPARFGQVIQWVESRAREHDSGD